jgi:phasin family protein
MTQQFRKHAFDQTSNLLNGAFVQKNFQVAAENALAASKSFCDKATAATLNHGKALTDIADTAWGSTKVLNERVIQNLISNIEVTFAAAHLIVGAKSLPEISKLQHEFLQKLAAQSMEQATELVEISTRAFQPVLEKVQALKPLA